MKIKKFILIIIEDLKRKVSILRMMLQLLQVQIIVEKHPSLQCLKVY